MTSIHPTAVVDPRAHLGNDVEIGPFSVIGPDVRLDDAVKIISHGVVAGRTRIGSGTRIFPFTSIGHEPQDLKYEGEPSELIIGCNNTIREHVTVNPGTAGGGMVTRIGDGCLLMVGVHVAHDCRIGNSVVMANNATLAGHVVVEDFAVIGGLSAIHQFVRIGAHAMIGGMTGIEQDVIPFGLAMGDRGHLAGLNLVGLKRRGFDRDDIHRLRAAFRMLFAATGEMTERMAAVSREHGDSPLVRQLLDFLGAESDRLVLKPRAVDGD